MYLRGRLSKFGQKDGFPDGGLLVADHILRNKKICTIFKKHIKSKIVELIKQMRTDVDGIGCHDIYCDLLFSKAIKEKINDVDAVIHNFFEQTEKEVILEIKTRDYLSPGPNNILPAAENAYIELLSISNVIFAKGELKQNLTFVDIFEIVLQNIYLIENNLYWFPIRIGKTYQ